MRNSCVKPRLGPSKVSACPPSISSRALFGGVAGQLLAGRPRRAASEGLPQRVVLTRPLAPGQAALSILRRVPTLLGGRIGRRGPTGDARDRNGLSHAGRMRRG